MGNQNRIVRQSPSGRKLGSFGFARLSLSKAAAFTDGVGKQIPFDTIDAMSEGFGALVTGGLLGAPGAFRLTETGIYLVQSFIVVDGHGTSFSVDLFAGSQVLGANDTAALDGLSISGNADVTDLTTTNGDIATEMVVTGTSGNITAATCLIIQVG